MKIGFILITFVQALVIVADEFLFHYKRFLPRWERIGHPLDTLTLIVCLAFLALFPHTPHNEIIYLVLGVFSCVFVTKDEWKHKEHCPPAEMWTHSLLFILHPLVLITAYTIWDTDTHLIQLMLIPISLFMIYQIFYWNFYAKN